MKILFPIFFFILINAEWVKAQENPIVPRNGNVANKASGGQTKAAPKKPAPPAEITVQPICPHPAIIGKILSLSIRNQVRSFLQSSTPKREGPKIDLGKYQYGYSEANVQLKKEFNRKGDTVCTYFYMGSTYPLFRMVIEK